MESSNKEKANGIINPHQDNPDDHVPLDSDNNLSILEGEKVPPSQSSNEPPNGGLVAWLQVLGSFFLFFNSWGIVNTFGVYQTYYQDNILSSESSSNISWVGTVQGFLLVIIGVITGPIFDKGHFRPLVTVGSAAVVFGTMMTSISTRYYQIFLAQGVVVGLGSGCLFVPSVAIVATYFTTKRALATGIVASGGSLGGVIYPIVFRTLQPKLGFPWATRIIGFIALGTLLISLGVMKPRLTPPKARSLLDLPAFKSPTFTLFSIGLFLAFAGLYIPFFYVPIYAIQVLKTKENLAFYLLAIMNAGSVFGRLLPNYAADKLGPLNVLVPCGIASTVLTFAWIAIKDIAGLILFSVLYGFFSGAMVSLPPTVMASIAPDMSLMGTWMGMSFSFGGLGLLVGNPIAGTTIDIPEAKFVGAQAFAGGMIAAGTVLFVVTRLMRARSSKGWKA